HGFPKYIAEATAHETGHQFGLYHQSVYDGTTKTAEYNPGNAQIAPVMGNSYHSDRGLWWDGASSLAYNQMQNDLNLLGGRIGRSPDDFPNAYDLAVPMTAQADGFTASGVINNFEDEDYLSFDTLGGNYHFEVNPF